MGGVGVPGANHTVVLQQQLQQPIAPVLPNTVGNVCRAKGKARES